MPLQNPLGFNLIPIGVATGLHVNMENLQGIVVICYEDGGAQAITIKESIDGASEQALTAINELWASSGVSGTFTRETSDASADLSDNSSLVKKDTVLFDQACFYIAKEELSAGFNCVEITIDGAGVCAVLGIPVVGRALQNQANIVAA
jgi:hypothetical protein